MIHFIVNPNSRSGYGAKVWKGLEKRLSQENEIEYELHMTTKPLEATHIARELCEQTAEELILVPVGGDGTLNEVINGLDFSRKDLYLGYIPTGSGNDFCRSMKMETEPMKVLEDILSREQIATVDVGELSCDYDSAMDACAGGATADDEQLIPTHTDGHFIRNRRFLVSCGCGYDAKVCHVLLVSKIKSVMNKLHLGKLCYITVGISEICKLVPFAATAVWGKEKRKELEHIAFCSMQIQPYEGGGFAFAPSADCTDGELEICVARTNTRLRFLNILVSSIFKKHVKRKGVNIIRTKKWSLTLPEHVAAHADGESMGCPRRMTVSCIPGALHVII